MSDLTATLIATVSLYSTGHWIGGTVVLIWLGLLHWKIHDDPYGMKSLLESMRGG